jgi:hypothetical protein
VNALTLGWFPSWKGQSEMVWEFIMQLRTSKPVISDALFISAIFHILVLDHCWPQVTETTDYCTAVYVQYTFCLPFIYFPSFLRERLSNSRATATRYAYKITTYLSIVWVLLYLGYVTVHRTNTCTGIHMCEMCYSFIYLQELYFKRLFN